MHVLLVVCLLRRLCLPEPSPHSKFPILFPFTDSLFLLTVCGECPRKSAPGNCPSTWVIPGCSLGVFTLSTGGLLKSVGGQTAPQGHCSTCPPPPQIGVLPPTPHPSCGGTSRGSSAASSTPSNTPICVLFVLFPSSICFQRCCWADGQKRGLSAHLAQGSEKGTPRARGDQLQYCTSWPVARGCVQ